jgi:HK97 family phage major capsid protein
VTPRVVPHLAHGSSTLEEFRNHIKYDHYGPEQTAFWRWALLPTPDPGADPREMLDQEEQRVLSKATGAAGGYLVPQDLEAQVISAARASSAMGQVASEFVTDSGETLLVPTSTAPHGVASWVAENAGQSATDETFGQASLGAFKANTVAIASEELAEDSAVPFDNYLGMELGGRLGDLEDTAFSVGDGSGKPLGIVHASSPYTVVTAATGSSLLYKLADVLAIYKALPAAYRPNASWVVHPDDFASLASTVDTAGGLVFPSLQYDPPSLFGRPVVLGAAMPTPAASAKSLAFGDWKRAYGIRRVRGVGMSKLTELYSNTGQLGFRAYERVDGRSLLTDSARILAHSAT